MLLREPHPLVAQVVDHPVVDADQRVHLRLPDRQEARREILVADQPRPRSASSSCTIQSRATSRRPDDERERRTATSTAEQPERGCCEQEIDAERRRRSAWSDDEVGDELGAQAHTVISYFSNRR